MTSHISMIPDDVMANATIDYHSLADPDCASQLRTILDEFGFAVVTNVLSHQEVVQYEALWAQDMLSIIDMPKAKQTCPPKLLAAVQHDPINNWPTDEVPLGRSKGAFASDYCLPHGKCPWAVRAHPNVRAVYENLFGDDLVVSMDNMFFSNKDSKIPETEREDRLWGHADQSKHVVPSGKWECYQGVIYLWPATVDTSSTVVWPGSHKSVYEDLMKMSTFRGHFCMLPKAQQQLFAQKAGRVAVPPGGLLLWSSRTVHQGWNHGKRLAVPVCFEPRNRRTKEALASKVQCIKTGMPTTHWASIGKMHVVANNNDGSSNELPLIGRAHEWIISNGKINPTIYNLL